MNMRRRSWLIIIALMLNVITKASPPPEPEDSWLLLNDYALASNWDKNLNSWTQTLKQVYQYDDNFSLTGIVSLDPNTNDTLSRVVYEYDEYGSMEAEYFQDMVSDIWVDKIKYIMDYDENHRRLSLTILIINNNEWAYSSRQINYTYNDKNQLVSYYNEIWSGSEWNLTLVDNFTYDDNGSLIFRLRTDLLGENAFRIYYYYNEFDQRTQMLVQYYQKSTGIWLDSYSDTYFYNLCGTRSLSFRERYVNGLWVNERKTDLFYKVEFPRSTRPNKIKICHNGVTLLILVNVLGIHLSHGDCIGSCQGGVSVVMNKSKLDVMLPEKPPFIVFPNPATDKITIRPEEKTEFEIQKLELLDYNGRLLRVYNIQGVEDVTIYRETLPVGNYCLRLTSNNNTYSSVVVFK